MSVLLVDDGPLWSGLATGPDDRFCFNPPELEGQLGPIPHRKFVLAPPGAGQYTHMWARYGYTPMTYDQASRRLRCLNLSHLMVVTSQYPPPRELEDCLMKFLVNKWFVLKIAEPIQKSITQRIEIAVLDQTKLRVTYPEFKYSPIIFQILQTWSDYKTCKALSVPVLAADLHLYNLSTILENNIEVKNNAPQFCNDIVLPALEKLKLLPNSMPDASPTLDVNGSNAMIGSMHQALIIVDDNGIWEGSPLVGARFGLSVHSLTLFVEGTLRKTSQHTLQFNRCRIAIKKGSAHHYSRHYERFGYSLDIPDLTGTEPLLAIVTDSCQNFLSRISGHRQIDVQRAVWFTWFDKPGPTSFRIPVSVLQAPVKIPDTLIGDYIENDGLLMGLVNPVLGNDFKVYNKSGVPHLSGKPSPFRINMETPWEILPYSDSIMSQYISPVLQLCYGKERFEQLRARDEHLYRELKLRLERQTTASLPRIVSHSTHFVEGRTITTFKCLGDRQFTWEDFITIDKCEPRLKNEECINTVFEYFIGKSEIHTREQFLRRFSKGDLCGLRPFLLGKEKKGREMKTISAIAVPQPSTPKKNECPSATIGRLRDLCRNRTLAIIGVCYLEGRFEILIPDIDPSCFHPDSSLASKTRWKLACLEREVDGAEFTIHFECEYLPCVFHTEKIGVPSRWTYTRPLCSGLAIDRGSPDKFDEAYNAGITYGTLGFFLHHNSLFYGCSNHHVLFYPREVPACVLQPSASLCRHLHAGIGSLVSSAETVLKIGNALPHLEYFVVNELKNLGVDGNGTEDLASTVREAKETLPPLSETILIEEEQHLVPKHLTAPLLQAYKPPQAQDIDFQAIKLGTPDGHKGDYKNKGIDFAYFLVGDSAGPPADPMLFDRVSCIEKLRSLGESTWLPAVLELMEHGPELKPVLQLDSHILTLHNHRLLFADIQTPRYVILLGATSRIAIGKLHPCYSFFSPYPESFPISFPAGSEPKFITQGGRVCNKKSDKDEPICTMSDQYLVEPLFEDVLHVVQAINGSIEGSTFSFGRRGDSGSAIYDLETGYVIAQQHGTVPWNGVRWSVCSPIEGIIEYATDVLGLAA